MEGTVPNSDLPTGILFRPATNKDCAEVTQLVFAILRNYGFSPDPGDTDRDLADIENFYRDGSFHVLAEVQTGHIIGTIGLHPLAPDTLELRKMYLHPDYRRRGLGRFLLKHALTEARRRGARRIYLETASVLHEAIALYRSAGFQVCDPQPGCASRCNVAMELLL